MCLLECVPGQQMVLESVYINQENSWTFFFFFHDKEIRHLREVFLKIFHKRQNVSLLKNLTYKRQSVEYN